jgi:outer membrane protein OmpA-like peptidoglycan-associated protein
VAELQLPGGVKVTVPEGSPNFGLATWLAGTDTTVPRRFVFDNLHFETGTTQLTSGSRITVESLAAILKAYPAVAVQLEGHTDNTGDPAANQKLSLDRANAVKALLVERGTADSRISTAGLGQDKPVASNDTEAGRARNRRIELVVEKR